MAWRVYEVRAQDRERCEADLAVDVVSRTSIQLRDARHFGWDRATFFVHLEGDEKALQVADGLVLKYGRVPQNAEALHRRLQWEDDASAASLGRVFAELPPPRFQPTSTERRRQVLEQARDAAVTARRKTSLWWWRLKKRMERS